MKSKKEKASVGRAVCRAFIGAILALSLVFTLSLAASAETASEETAKEESGFLDSAVSAVSEHLPLLFSTLTLVGTAVLARLFRSSLLPILDSGLKRVGGGVEELEDKTKALLERSEGELSALSALVEHLAEETGGEAARLGSLRADLQESMASLSDSVRLEAERVDAVLRMLKEVFTAARLPASSKLALEEIYRKTPMSGDRVGESSPKSEGSL
jgi:hypothetical protein